MKKLIFEVVGSRYYVLELLGTGGFSEVYKVRDIHTGKIYAMKKYITSNPNDLNNLLEGLERELNVLRYTSHPVLPKIYNLIKEDESFYLIMEYVDGVNLRDMVRDKRPFKNKEIKSIMKQVLSGLYYLHSLNPPIIYRDLKPSNIVMNNSGKIKLVDFGVAKRYSKEIEVREKSFGTKGFAAPEQFGNKDGFSIYNTDVRTDIYGAGTTMYYLRAGEVYKMDYWPISIGWRLQKIIGKCTKPEPEKRYQDCIELLTCIEKL